MRESEKRRRRQQATNGFKLYAIHFGRTSHKLIQLLAFIISTFRNFAAQNVLNTEKYNKDSRMT